MVLGDLFAASVGRPCSVTGLSVLLFINLIVFPPAWESSQKMVCEWHNVTLPFFSLQEQEVNNWQWH